MTLDNYRYISVEEPISAGKTSLAKQHANYLGDSLLLENPRENPFIEKFYYYIPYYALLTQLFFIFQHANQVQNLKQTDLYSRIIICDFLLEKDPLFDKLSLSDEEYRLYQQIYEHSQPLAPIPDLVIYLQASPETLVLRVKRRCSPNEKKYPKAIYGSYLIVVHSSFISMKSACYDC